MGGDCRAYKECLPQEGEWYCNEKEEEIARLRNAYVSMAEELNIARQELSLRLDYRDVVAEQAVFIRRLQGELSLARGKKND